MSDNNPYDAPDSDVSTVVVHPNLAKIVSSQKIMLLSILSFILAVMLMIVARLDTRILMLACYVIMVYCSGSIAYYLGTRWYYVAALVICLWIPLVNLVLLLRVNAKANDIIGKAGLSVGFLGAKKSSA